MKVTVSAPGKVTLFGEHAVVYGKPALVSAIDRRVHVTVEERSDSSIKVSALDLHIPGLILTFKEGSKDLVVETDYNRIAGAMSYVRKAIELASKHIEKRQGVNVTIRSEMPVGAGLGTSAAIAVGTVAAYTRLLGHELKAEEVARLGHATEFEVQGAASPMDTAISTYGGTIYLRPTRPDPYIERLKISFPLPSIIGYTEREARTGELLKRVRELRKAHPAAVDSILSTIHEIVEEARIALVKGDLVSLGVLMNMNHGQLESLGVSSRRLNDMVYSARSAGAIGSKMTGAGGGGCMIALCPNRIEEVSVAIRVVGGSPIQASLSGTGFRLESVEK
ncbi:MAG: mevalonate kinase [Candidatus Verstraetearchaeota archaeon]|nr:mevalonate kinase [Candidatus Verstraetearchaeota archaeon]